MKDLKNMRSVGTSLVTEVLLGSDLYQRQVEAYRKPIWFKSNDKLGAWVFVGLAKQVTLEAAWNDLHATAPTSDEELEDALCEQMASDDYEASFYA